MRISKITLTGADDTIDPADLKAISQEYPDVEWGILFGGNTNFVSRFPSQGWIQELYEVKQGLNLCAHFCGKPVIELLKNGDYSKLPGMFQRCQLNFHGENIKSYFPEAEIHLQKALNNWSGEFIFQVDGVNDGLVNSWVQKGLGDPLFDTSSGAGVTPSGFGDTWPKLWIYNDGEPVYCGYAGGLGPDNILDELGMILDVVEDVQEDAEIWIDMETKVRTRGLFDLDKCRDILNTVYEAGYVVDYGC